MARRGLDSAAAKQARQKKISIGGFVVLLGVLALSVPKTLKMLEGPQAVADPTAPVTPATPVLATPDAPALASAATLVDTGAAPPAEVGQLATFERFESKDPFVQQVDPTPAPEPAAAAPAAPAAVPAEAAAADAEAEAPDTPELPAPAPRATAPVEPPAAQPATPATPATRAVVITVNGVREAVELKGAFPKADKVFELRSIGSGEVKVGIAGGSLTGGAQAVTLRKGKKVTLMNTADGTRYELVLVSLA